MLAWHFLGEDRELRKRSIHASKKILDALKRSSGPIICRVDLGGEILEDKDKLIAEERKELWRINGEELLLRFVRACAWDVVDRWDAPEVVRQYLLTGDEGLRVVAASAAWYTAARNSMIAAHAAWITELAVFSVRNLETAACAAWIVEITTEIVARSTESTARSSIWDKYNHWLTAMVLDEHRKGVRC